MLAPTFGILGESMFRRVCRWIGPLLVCLATAELVARFDDWLFFDAAILSTPDRQRDLELHASDTIRGKPNGAHRKWKLNTDGFRGPAIDPRPAGKRVMILGASETFGARRRRPMHRDSISYIRYENKRRKGGAPPMDQATDSR